MREEGQRVLEGDCAGFQGAYAADGFTFYTPSPEHEDPRPIIFYHKYCTLAGFGGDFIGTQYDCDDLNR